MKELFQIIWLFGAISFGYLAQFCLVIWRVTYWITGTIIISQEDFIKFLDAMRNSYEFVELYD